MIIDKAEFKSLLKDSGKVKTKAINVKCVTHNKIGEFIIMDKGIFFKSGFSFRYYINVDNIINTVLTEKILTIEVHDSLNTINEEFRASDSNTLLNLYNFIQKVLPEDKKKEFITVESEAREVYPYIPQPVVIENMPKKITERQRIKQLKKDRIPYCTKCHSTSLQYVERRKQLSVARGIVGNTIGAIVSPGLAPAGTVIGALTSKKYKGHMKCLNCGHTWKK